MSKRIRQYLGIVCALICYYIVHEGAHFLTAQYYGVFKQINFMGLGIQVDVYHTQMTEIQMGIFCISGAVATFLCGWLLILLCSKICTVRAPLFRTIMWYTSLIMLLLDPLYLSVLCSFFGGGDMNGISLLLPEFATRIGSAAIGVIQGVVIWRYLLPNYAESFSEV